MPEANISPTTDEKPPASGTPGGGDGGETPRPDSAAPGAAQPEEAAPAGEPGDGDGTGAAAVHGGAEERDDAEGPESSERPEGPDGPEGADGPVGPPVAAPGEPDGAGDADPAHEAKEDHDAHGAEKHGGADAATAAAVGAAGAAGAADSAEAAGPEDAEEDRQRAGLTPRQARRVRIVVSGVVMAAVAVALFVRLVSAPSVLTVGFYGMALILSGTAIGLSQRGRTRVASGVLVLGFGAVALAEWLLASVQ